jgi:hypothetical protein
LKAERIDQQRHPGLFDSGIVLLDVLVERKAIFKTRAATTGHKDP